MRCLVKAGIQGNKKCFWSDTIYVNAEQLEAENQYIPGCKSQKRDFFELKKIPQAGIKSG